jgi:MoxR-like ATPase
MAKVAVSKGNEWELVSKILAAPINVGSYRVCLSGPPGIGKTLTPIKTLRACGYKTFIAGITEETPMSELRGHFILKGNEFVWHDGVMMRAWRESHGPHPVCLIINEIDKSPGDVLSFFHTLLDDPDVAEIHLPTGEVLKPKKDNIRYIATMNGVPQDLPAPLRSRFPIMLEMKKVHPDALACISARLQVAAKNILENSHDRPYSIREFIAYESLAASIGEMDALTAIFGSDAPMLVDAVKIKEF